MLTTLVSEVMELNDKLNEAFMKVMIEKVEESKRALLESHDGLQQSVISALSGVDSLQCGHGIIIDEIMKDIIDTMKLKHDQKMKLLREYGDGMKQIATHYGLSNEVRVKSENDGNSMNTNIEAVIDEEPSNQMPSDDELTESEEEIMESNNNAIVSSRQNVYIPPLKCKFDSKLFYFHSDFKSHMMLEHDISKPYECSRCDASYGDRGNLVKHIETKHENVTNYECGVCFKRFYAKSDWRQHKITHTDDQPYQCDECGKRFNDPCNHHKHIHSVHKEVKHHACRFCGKGFYEKSNFTRHLRIHTGEKPFHCETCDTSFSDKSSLIRHERIHSGVKPYECSKCHKRFTRSGNMKKHERKCKK